MAEKNNHTQNEAVASFLQTASAIVKPPTASSLGNFNLAPQRKMPAADVIIHFQKRARIIEVSGLQPHPAMSPELLQVRRVALGVQLLLTCFCIRSFSTLRSLLQTSGG
jgi:hypothetical protein